MVGLIYKDLCCLRKHIKLFAVWTFIVIILAVLFILSMKYGNVAQMIASMSEEEFFGMFQTAIWCILIVPIASSAMIQECFKEDTKSNFKKCLYTLPIKEETAVFGRYMSGLAFLFLGFLGNLAASICIALSTDVIKFKQLLGFSVTFLALMIVYEAFVMFVLYTVDGKKADLIQCVPLVIWWVLWVVFFTKNVDKMTDEQFTAFLKSIMDKLNDLMTNKCIWILLFALVFMGLSYIGSVFMQKKRGLR